MLLKNQDPRLAAFVVWVPELGAQQKDVAGARSRIALLGPHETVGIEFGRLLPTPSAAWDVYMLFGAEVIWPKTGVPKPDFWMQQLSGVTIAPRLDGGVFASRAAALLKQVR